MKLAPTFMALSATDTDSSPSHLDDDRLTGDTVVPATVWVLGAGGLIPFVTLAAAMWLVPNHADRLSAALVDYGAVILAFMGAVHWGLAMGSDRRGSSKWYVLGVLPAMTGWLAMMLPPGVALVVLAIGFCAVMVIDGNAIAIGLAPRWYRRLRQPLTAAVVASLMLGATALRTVGT